MTPTAIVLFSGGLDSLLTVRMLQEQGIAVIGLNLVTPFHDASAEALRRAEDMNIELVIRSFGDEYMAMLTHPRWGTGKGHNPCIDCRVAMLKAAKELMEERGADFVATGEISGQRPNSQMMHQLNLITRESGLGGRLVRPLSAKVLPPSDAENDGLLDRERLLACTGRGRGRLIARARRRYQIESIPQPSTGCLLCEKSFSPRVKDLIRFKPQPTVWDAQLLQTGRHLRIDDGAKAVVARRQADGERLAELFERADRSRSFLTMPKNFNGPTVLVVTDAAPPADAVRLPDDEPFERYRHIAGGLTLRFDAPEKLAHLTNAPTVELRYGTGLSENLSIEPDETADRLPMILEIVRKS